MKKTVSLITGLILAGSALTGCFDEKDFDLSKLSLKGLDPEFYLPLLNDTVRLSVKNSYNIHYDNDGVGYLRFPVNKGFVPETGEFFAVPDTIFDIVGVAFNYPGSGNVYHIPEETVPLEFKFLSNDQQIDSLVFDSGTLTFTNYSIGFSGSYSVTIPKLRNKNGEPFSTDIIFSDTEQSIDSSLAGYSLAFDSKANNRFDVITEANVSSSTEPAGDYRFKAQVSFSKVGIGYAGGYFGQRAVDTVTVAQDITTFNKFRESSPGASLQIEKAYIAFAVRSSAGFPVRLNIVEAASTGTSPATSSATSVTSVMNAGSVTIPAAPEPGTYWNSYPNFGGNVLGEVLSNMPERVEFQISATINPDGNPDRYGNPVKNFLTRDDSIKVSDIEVRIPLKFKARNIVLLDTLDFDLSTMTLEELELFMNINNTMPVGVDLQACPTGDDGEPLTDDDDEPIVLFTDKRGEPVPVPVPAGKDTSYAVSVANVNRLNDARKLKVEITVNTPEVAEIKQDNYIHLSIGARTRLSIEELK
ncbi:MAG: hypothetical protein LBT49_06495 [Prevotellaceae bacterium]|nr:hypothetical protein [Prevotellaceae bacterium]